MTYAVNEYKPRRRDAKIAQLVARGVDPSRAAKEVPKRYECIIRLTLPNGRAIVDRKLTGATSESGAKAWAKAREIDLIRRAGAPPTPKHVPTLNAWWPKYMRACIGEGLADSTLALKQHCFDAWLAQYLGDLPLNEITNEKRSALQHAMTLDGVGRSGMSNTMQALSAALNKAIEHGELASMPCKFGKTARLKTATSSHTPFYQDPQLAALLDGAPDLQTKVIILLGCDAGLRAGEIAGVDWNDVAFDRVEITVRRSIWYGVPAAKRQAWIEAGRPRDARPKPEHVVKLPKHDKIRRVPMTRRLASALRKLRLRSRTERVLVTADGKWLHRDTISDWLAVAEARAGVPRDGEGCVHVLRHTFCSRIALRGVPARVIMELAGHHSITVTQRYMHLAPNSTTSAVELLEIAANGTETRAETNETDSATG